MPLLIASPAFENAAPMPALYTCEGQDISPPLRFEGVPAGAKSLALIVDDPDAPDPMAPKLTWVHWVLFNIPPSVRNLPERVTVLPEGTREGITNFERTGYGGPCPPIGVHRYYFKLYALDARLDLAETPDKDMLLAAMAGHILEEASLMGTYKLGKKR